VLEYRQIERVKGADTPGAVMRLLQQPTVAGPSPAWHYRDRNHILAAHNYPRELPGHSPETDPEPRRVPRWYGL
jgi:hypothetical protein